MREAHAAWTVAAALGAAFVALLVVVISTAIYRLIDHEHRLLELEQCRCQKPVMERSGLAASSAELQQ